MLVFCICPHQPNGTHTLEVNQNCFNLILITSTSIYSLSEVCIKKQETFIQLEKIDDSLELLQWIQAWE